MVDTKRHDKWLTYYCITHKIFVDEMYELSVFAEPIKTRLQKLITQDLLRREEDFFVGKDD